MAGWIKLYRSLLDAEQMTDDWLCRLFVWCLLRANHTGSLFRGQQVYPGQFVTGRVSAAAELSVSPSKWYRGIERLTDMGAIATLSNSNWTTITICNWSTYQDETSESRTASEHQLNSQRTASGQPADTIEECKNNTTHTLAAKLEGLSEAVIGVEIEGELVLYHQDHLRWEAEFIRQWNGLRNVSQHLSMGLDTFERRLLIERLQEPDWFWKRAFQMFPLWSNTGWRPSLMWFVEFGNCNRVLSSKYTHDSATEKPKGKRNDRKGPDNAASIFATGRSRQADDTWGETEGR